MYTSKNFPTKKALKTAVISGEKLTVFQFNDMFGNNGPDGTAKQKDGVVYLEGPHYPRPHSWYAQATLREGIIVSVK